MNWSLYIHGNLVVKYCIDAYDFGNNKYNSYREMKGLNFIKHIKTKTKYSRALRGCKSYDRYVKIYKRKNNISSTYVVNYLTEQLLKQSYNYIKKVNNSLLKKTKKRRRFLVEEELGKEIVDRMYNSEWFNMNPAYEENKIRAKEDLIFFLRHNQIISKQGYYIVDDIVSFIEERNARRKQNGELYNPIKKNFDMFVRDLLNYNLDVINAMREMKCVFARANRSIFENVKKYWIDYDDNKVSEDVRRGKKIIILKRLTRKKRKKRSR